tara:strand:- start:2262 stop:2645 length:384 start_codon:yes stop_codon:yes gene_type:complete
VLVLALARVYLGPLNEGIHLKGHTPFFAQNTRQNDTTSSFLSKKYIKLKDKTQFLHFYKNKNKKTRFRHTSQKRKTTHDTHTHTHTHTTWENEENAAGRDGEKEVQTIVLERTREDGLVSAVLLQRK